METATYDTDTDRYAKCIEVSKRVRWDIDDDVIRGREFDYSHKFLPDGLSRVDTLEFLSGDEQRFLSQVQGRTYANIFGLVERYITAKVLEISHDHCFGDQTAVEALVRFSDEELKHQELFRRLEEMLARSMPEGYTFLPDPNEVASVVLGKSTWAVLALTCHIELFTQAHYEQSIEPHDDLSELYKDVFLFHWKEESQHAVMDELEWTRENSRMSDTERDKAVDELIDLVAAVDGILQVQADADVKYFLKTCPRTFDGEETRRIESCVLDAYRWQYIVSGVQHPRFGRILGAMINESQGQRINEALAPIMQ